MPREDRTTLRAWNLQVGDEIEQWRVIGLLEIAHGKDGCERPAYLCRCKCGTERRVDGHTMCRGGSKSCGCLGLSKLVVRCTSHGRRKHRLYDTWYKMKDRCENPDSPKFKDYGARGIKVCDEWREDLEAFIAWAHSSGYRNNLTIERKDVNGDYCPENAEWITKGQQQLNKTNSLPPVTAYGETKLLALWAQDRRCRVSLSTLTHRIHRGWNPERAISEPPRPISRSA